MRAASSLIAAAGACVLALAASVPVSARQAQTQAAAPAAPAPAPATAAQAAPARGFKNVQVLTDVPPAQMNPSMHLIAGQLGVGCTYCHIWEEWDREDRPQKQVARRMMAMTIDLNRNLFGRRTVVTCYTCHRGKPIPVNTPELPSPVAPRFDDPPPPPPPPMPAVDRIIERYIEALGGEAKLRAVTSRVITGTRDIPSGPGGIDATPSQVEVSQKGSLTRNTYITAKFTVADGYDGTNAWTQTAAGAVNTVAMPDAGRVKRAATLHDALELKQIYTSLEVRGTEMVGRRKAYVVVGTPDGDMPERLYFDTETGLLLRRATFFRTPLGDSPFQMDFDDYRTVAGVKMPFLVRMNPAGPRTELGTSSTLRVKNIKVNVPLDDALFVRPQPKPRPQG